MIRNQGRFDDQFVIGGIYICVNETIKLQADVHTHSHTHTLYTTDNPKLLVRSLLVDIIKLRRF